jgi:hypothetical protein
MAKWPLSTVDATTFAGVVALVGLPKLLSNRYFRHNPHPLPTRISFLTGTSFSSPFFDAF